jgi:hypothetical protein
VLISNFYNTSKAWRGSSAHTPSDMARRWLRWASFMSFAIPTQGGLMAA